MKNIEINIELNPVKDGASWVPDHMKRKGRGALIIGTNGKYRFAQEEEAIKLFNEMSGFCESDYMGDTNLLVLYNSKKVLNTCDGRFLAGSVMIMKATEKGVEFINESEIEAAKAGFESRLVTLCGNGIQFSAYEIG